MDGPPVIAQLPLFELAHVTGGVQLSLDDVRTGPELVVVIPCSGEKAPGLRNAAGELFTAAERYTGQFHRYARQHAERLGADRVLILSAAYGLLRLTDLCPDYEKKITDKDSIASTPGKLAHQALALGLRLDDVRVVSLCPAAYSAELARAIPDLVEPLAGSRGIGEQRGRIARLTRTDLLEGTPR